MCLCVRVCVRVCVYVCVCVRVCVQRLNQVEYIRTTIYLPTRSTILFLLV